MDEKGVSVNIQLPRHFAPEMREWRDSNSFQYNVPLGKNDENICLGLVVDTTHSGRVLVHTRNQYDDEYDKRPRLLLSDTTPSVSADVFIVERVAGRLDISLVNGVVWVSRPATVTVSWLS
jgi:hypothetical protein